jgi:hypothetical protein
MLSELQQKRVWEGQLAAEIRASYFADLANSYQRVQRRVTWTTLVLSSGAAATLLADGIPHPIPARTLRSMLCVQLCSKM